MKRLCLILLMFFSFVMPVKSSERLLTGSVVYTLETAKEEAFQDLDLKIDKNILKYYLVDINNKENRNALANGITVAGREIMSFQTTKGLVRGYTIVYDNEPQHVYYYSTGGYLVGFDINNNLDNFPYKVGKYHPITGNLISVAFYVSETEQYVYNKNGKLKAHWVDDIAYNEKGKIIAKRALVDSIPVD